MPKAEGCTLAFKKTLNVKSFELKLWRCVYQWPRMRGGVEGNGFIFEGIYYTCNSSYLGS